MQHALQALHATSILRVWHACGICERMHATCLADVACDQNAYGSCGWHMRVHTCNMLCRLCMPPHLLRIASSFAIEFCASQVEQSSCAGVACVWVSLVFGS